MKFDFTSWEMDWQESISKSDGAIKNSRKNTSTQPTAHTLKSFLDGMSQTV